MTAEEYVVQNLQEAEENIQELEAANRYLTLEVSTLRNDLFILADLFEKNEIYQYYSTYDIWPSNPLHDKITVILQEVEEMHKKYDFRNAYLEGEVEEEEDD